MGQLSQGVQARLSDGPPSCCPTTTLDATCSWGGAGEGIRPEGFLGEAHAWHGHTHRTPQALALPQRPGGRLHADACLGTNGFVMGHEGVVRA